MLSVADNAICPSHKFKNANKCCHFKMYDQNKCPTLTFSVRAEHPNTVLNLGALCLATSAERGEIKFGA